MPTRRPRAGRPNAWNCYPWDAQAYGRNIYAHEELARECAGEVTNKKRKAEDSEAMMSPEPPASTGGTKKPAVVAA